MKEKPEDKAAEIDNEIDPSKLTLPQNFETMVGVKKALLSVQVRKPERQWFVRVHPDEKWRINTAVIEDKETKETYLIDPALWQVLPGEITPKILFTAINRQGVIFLWPVRLPGEDGKLDQWNKTAFETTQLAMRSWIRIASNLGAGTYDVFQCTGNLPEPEWPDTTFKNLLTLAFKDRFIRSADHQVLKKLRGEM